MRLHTYVFAFAFTLCSVPVGAQNTAGMAAWRPDLETIAKELPARHPNAFYRMTRASWDSAVTSIDTRLPTMTRNQAAVAFMQLVAMVKDGHTTINPLFDRAFNGHYYPVELRKFSDGLYVKSAAPEYRSIVGAKVVKFGKMSAADALAAAATTIGHENEWWTDAWAASRVTVAEIADGLGMVADINNVPIVVDHGGKIETAILHPTGRIEPMGHNPLGGINRAGWIDMRDTTTTPLWLKNPGRPYWSEFVKSDGTLYVSYRAVMTLDDLPNQVFWKGVFAQLDSLPVRRFVIDIRDNGGGNSFFNKQVVRGIVAHPQIDRPDRLFVITGSKTFSAAMNLARDIEQWTNATFVGEPTGNALVFFGDHLDLNLPVSGLTVNVSSLPWYPSDARDTRAFIGPRLYTPLTSAEYRANVDPAMQAILAKGAEPQLGDKIEQAISRGDTAGALSLIKSAGLDSINRFHSPESDVNALGYRLVGSNRAEALAVFRLNTIAFPQSANVWDSYGETLIADGQRDAGIAAYRRALELSPGFVPSANALARLGVR